VRDLPGIRGRINSIINQTSDSVGSHGHPVQAASVPALKFHDSHARRSHSRGITGSQGCPHYEMSDNFIQTQASSINRRGFFIQPGNATTEEL